MTGNWRTFTDTFILPVFFVLKMLSAAYIQVHFRLDFFMVANTMNPDQIAHSGAVIYIGEAPITQVIDVGNKNCNIQAGFSIL